MIYSTHFSEIRRGAENAGTIVPPIPVLAQLG